ncbi:hypothetical protein FH972_013567 [Carpinus fangiana]|uniref:Uncharacterized protein n=1 Tax=Carpinus fangiana TaxID=176857 RepID=A0A5N6R766_9ROSI|nr:hypothetical protein FH972_013567 [Carpinus fangiana]
MKLDEEDREIPGPRFPESQSDLSRQLRRQRGGFSRERRSVRRVRGSEGDRQGSDRGKGKGR